MNETSLDETGLYTKLDPGGMLAALRGLPEQCRQAWKAALDFTVPEDYREVDNILVLGMGGSAIGGDLVRTLVAGESRLPVIVHRDYGLPHFVNDRTLVIVSSYSGNTEETVSGFTTVLKSNAKKIALTTGGRVGELAHEYEIPLFNIDYKGQPRAAIGYGVFPLLCILHKIGLLWDKSNDVEETIEVLEALREKLDAGTPTADNPAKQLAQRLAGRVPVIYGGGFTGEAAHRWKTQINENAKCWAFHEVFPELNHNATVGFPYPEEAKKLLRVIFLRSSLMNRRLKLRYEVTAELLDRAGIQHEAVEAVGESALAQVMGLVYMGDFTSYYLAMLGKIDPSPVEVIDYLKKRLAEG